MLVVMGVRRAVAQVTQVVEEQEDTQAEIEGSHRIEVVEDTVEVGIAAEEDIGVAEERTGVSTEVGIAAEEDRHTEEGTVAGEWVEVLAEEEQKD
jgi:hypothetical protein